MSEFKKYVEYGNIELRPVDKNDLETYQKKGFIGFQSGADPFNGKVIEIFISPEYKKQGSPKLGDMIMRSPENQNDQWLVSEEYLKQYGESIKNIFEKTINIDNHPHVESVKLKDGKIDSIKWNSTEILNYINSKLTDDGTHSYIEFGSEKNIMNAIAAKFGFKQDGSFKLVQGIHNLTSNSTENSWRMYGRKETLKMEAVFPGFGETTEFKRLSADKLIVLLNYYQYPVIDPLGLSHPILDELYIGGFIDKSMNREIVSWKLTEKGLEYVRGILNVQIVKSDKDFNGLLRIGKGTFGMAVEAAKQGLKVARAGWNGSDMFAYIVPAGRFPVLADAAKSYFGENAYVEYRPYWALKTAQNDVATWAPSGSDSLAEDWMIVE